MQSTLPLRIIKLGGSLLNLVDLRQRFQAWLETQPPARNLVVVGGGQAVEAIRELDATHRFPATLTHWLSIELMSVTATLATEILGHQNLISTESELNSFLSRECESSTIACIQPTAYYTPAIAAQKKCTLPESWDCTSDSISAWLASSLAADQLVLLKSIEAELESTGRWSFDALQTLVDRGAVDPVFPDMCQQLRDIRVINLRAAV